ncbi:MAG TPA: DinB family protein [Candidatus Sulfotelmatobacter sp.]|nr:DinB family protein [Candidatus Sulfotelmatobacter sp.]
MSELTQIISTAFAGEYRMRAAELHKWADPLSEEQFWRNPYSYGNSVGHLVLHLTGNLSYYIGARIAETGYVRNRDLEFTESRRPTKADVLRKFDETIAMVVATIERQSQSDWTLPYSAEREPEAKDRFTAVLRCAVHFYHHIGQINYLCRELARA